MSLYLSFPKVWGGYQAGAPRSYNDGPSVWRFEARFGGGQGSSQAVGTWCLLGNPVHTRGSQYHWAIVSGLGTMDAEHDKKRRGLSGSIHRQPVPISGVCAVLEQDENGKIHSEAKPEITQHETMRSWEQITPNKVKEYLIEHDGFNAGDALRQLCLWTGPWLGAGKSRWPKTQQTMYHMLFPLLCLHVMWKPTKNSQNIHGRKCYSQWTMKCFALPHVHHMLEQLFATDIIPPQGLEITSEPLWQWSELVKSINESAENGIWMWTGGKTCYVMSRMMCFQIFKRVCVDAEFLVFREPSLKLAETAPRNVARDTKISGCIDCTCSGFTYFLFASCAWSHRRCPGWCVTWATTTWISLTPMHWKTFVCSKHRILS